MDWKEYNKMARHLVIMMLDNLIPFYLLELFFDFLAELW
jgi:hypothetical protein